MNLVNKPKARQFLIILYLVAVTLVIFGTRYSWSYDDPYITYRYAANLASGIGFVYNPAERILSTTAPLFAILLAIIRVFWHDLPRVANLVGAISLAVGGYLLWDLARIWKTPLAGWICLFLYPLFPQVVTTLGSETPLYLALIIGGFHAYARKRYVWVALWCGLAILVRPDAALVPIVIGLDFLIRIRKPIPWSAVAVFIAITLSWLVFSVWYFGSPLPVTLFVKQQQGVMAISQRFFQGFFALLRNYHTWDYLLQAALAVIGLTYTVVRRSPWLLFIGWTILYFLAYSTLGVSRYFWYYSPLTPGFVLLVGLGLEAIWEMFRFPYPRFRVSQLVGMNPSGKRLNNLLTYFSIGIIALIACTQMWKFWQNRNYRDARMNIYQQVGEYLYSTTPADATIGALEVGAIGYYSERRMIDFAGLIQPEVAQQMKQQTTYQDTASWAIERFHPDYLALPKDSFPQLEQGYVASNCTIVHTFDGKNYGYQGILDIYQCSSNTTN